MNKNTSVLLDVLGVDDSIDVGVFDLPLQGKANN